MEKINPNAINPYIRVAMYSTLKKNTVIPQRIIFDYELIYVADGTFTFHYDGVSYRCHAGQFLLIRPDVPHSFDCSHGDLVQPHIHFDMFYTKQSHRTPVSFKDRAALSSEERTLIQKDLFASYPRTPFVSFSDPETALACFYRVIRLYRESEELCAKGALIELIAMLLRDQYPDSIEKEEEATTGDPIRQIKDFIDSTHGIGLTLERLEKQFFYSKFYLEKQFKKQYGKSLIAYKNQKRLEHACILLSHKSVSEVAQELGYTSIYTFSRAFKSAYGCAPTVYREKEERLTV